MDDNKNFDFDIGDNTKEIAEELGFTYLFLRFLLPLVVGIILVAIVYHFITDFLHLVVQTNLYAGPTYHGP